jgi:hypothetical protein
MIGALVGHAVVCAAWAVVMAGRSNKLGVRDVLAVVLVLSGAGLAWKCRRFGSVGGIPIALSLLVVFWRILHI